MARIELTDDTVSAIIKIAEGNPGAMSALADVIEKHGEIDPQALMGALGVIMILDTWEIYGAGIYVLYNDQCNRDVRQFIMLLRAVQLGYFSAQKLKTIASDATRSYVLSEAELYELDKQVCERLADFQRKAE